MSTPICEGMGHCAVVSGSGRPEPPSQLHRILIRLHPFPCGRSGRPAPSESSAFHGPVFLSTRLGQRCPLSHAGRGWCPLVLLPAAGTGAFHICGDRDGSPSRNREDLQLMSYDVPPTVASFNVNGYDLPPFGLDLCSVPANSFPTGVIYSDGFIHCDDELPPFLLPLRRGPGFTTADCLKGFQLIVHVVFSHATSRPPIGFFLNWRTELRAAVFAARP